MISDRTLEAPAETEQALCYRYATAARMLDCSTRHIRSLVKRGTLRTVSLGPKARRITRAELVRYVEHLEANLTR